LHQQRIRNNASFQKPPSLGALHCNRPAKMPEPTTDCPMHSLFGSKALNMEPQTGDAALQHLNVPEYSDIVLRVDGAGVFYAHRSYLTCSDRFKSYGESETLWKGQLLLSASRRRSPISSITWFITCTRGRFCKIGVVVPVTLEKRHNVFCFAPKWIPIQILSEILFELVTHNEVKAADKIKIIRAWFGRGEDFSKETELNVFDLVRSKCPVDDSMTLKTMRALQKELGSVVFHGVVPGSYLGEIYDINLGKIKSALNIWRCEEFAPINRDQPAIKPAKMPKHIADPPLSDLFGSKTPHIEPQTGDAALQHFNEPEYSDIVLQVKGAGTARVVSISAPIPNQFYSALYYLYTGEILEDWVCAGRLAETMCTADYFMLEDVKKEAIKRFPSLWKSAITSSFFAPKWIPIQILSKILSELVTHNELKAADKIRIIGAWFGRGDDLHKSNDSDVSPDLNVFKLMLSKCAVDASMTVRTVHKLRKELGPLIFSCIVPGSFLGEVYDMNLNKIKSYLRIWQCTMLSTTDKIMIVHAKLAAKLTMTTER
ncbi:hypothetical protein HK102_002408, partial [Quaeritorhiza haematococci]